MRFPWIQLDQDALERIPAFSAWIGVDEDACAGKLLRAFRWGTTLGPEDGPPDGVCVASNAKRRLAAEMRYQGDPEILVEAMEACGFLELLTGGLRIRGTSRYRAVWEKNRRRRPSKQDDRNGNHPAPERTGPVPERSAAVPEPQTQTQTQTEASEKPLSAGADGRVRESVVPPEPTGTALEANTKDVFDYWRRASGRSGRTVLDSHRRTRVLARLREGSTVAELCEAVDGCLATPHNRGENETGQRYDDLELICRSAANVERFRRNAVTPPKRPPKTNRQPDWNADHLRDADGNLSFV